MNGCEGGGPGLPWTDNEQHHSGIWWRHLQECPEACCYISTSVSTFPACISIPKEPTRLWLGSPNAKRATSQLGNSIMGYLASSFAELLLGEQGGPKVAWGDTAAKLANCAAMHIDMHVQPVL